MSFLPEIGPPDPGALEFINSVWHRIPDDAVFIRYGLPPIRLRKLIKEEREGIRKQVRFRNNVVAAVEKVTGARRQVEAQRQMTEHSRP